MPSNAAISMMEGPGHSDVFFWHVRFFFNAICKFGRFVLALQVLPQIAETYEYPNSKLQVERSSFLHMTSIVSPCHIEVRYLKHHGQANQADFHTKGQRSHNIPAMAATSLDSPDIRSQSQSQKCKKHQKNSNDFSLRAFISNVLEMFQACKPFE